MSKIPNCHEKHTSDWTQGDLDRKIKRCPIYYIHWQDQSYLQDLRYLTCEKGRFRLTDISHCCGTVDRFQGPCGSHEVTMFRGIGPRRPVFPVVVCQTSAGPVPPEHSWSVEISQTNQGVYAKTVKQTAPLHRQCGIGGVHSFLIFLIYW